jgi:hypothetical protein
MRKFYVPLMLVLLPMLLRLASSTVAEYLIS